MIPFEREFPLAQARLRVESELAHLGLTWRAEQHGASLNTTIVELQDPARDTRYTGTGKGRGDFSLTGALYEACEHYLSLYHACSLDHALIPAAQVPAGMGAPVDAFLAAQPGEHLACRVYTGYLDGACKAYPLALSRPTYLDAPDGDDTFDYTGLARYASNSGTAIGATFAEAALHALNECVERDDVSRFLRRHFHDDTDEPLRVLDARGSGSVLRRDWTEAEAEIGASITLLDISTHAAAHTYLAFGARPGRPQHLYGAGASGDAVHAASRALAELVQVHAVADHVPAVGNDLACEERRLRPWKRLHRSCIADLPALCGRRRLERVTLPRQARSLAVAGELERGMAALAAEGYRPLVHVLYSRPETLTLCQVLVPGFDRYYLVSRGGIVVPGFERGAPHGHA
ncbi:YcaO-like family protein [Luteibacter sp.]|uniref:YcaO-like family protein n=1 Tax=Luteibacter sp. TaxID=1886636 RepID=UPI003F81E36B